MPRFRMVFAVVIASGLLMLVDVRAECLCEHESRLLTDESAATT
jgi:hypothetical protein